MPKIIDESKLSDVPELMILTPTKERFNETYLTKCLECRTPLPRPKWGIITTEDLDYLELDETVYHIGVVIRCKKCGTLNRKVYADNLSDETLMSVERVKE